MEIGTSTRFASASTTGIARRCSSAASTAAAPGRVDSPPTSRMPAPSSAIRTQASTAAAASKSTPPSERESGVTLMTPMMTVRSPRGSVRPPGSGTVNRRRGCMSRRVYKTRPTPVYRNLFLRNGTRRNRGNNRLTLLRLRRRRGGLRRRRRRPPRFVERLPPRDAAHLLGVERLVHEQRVGHLEQPRLGLVEDLPRARVRLGHEALHLVIDLQRGVPPGILVLRDLAAEADLLFLLSEGQR